MSKVGVFLGVASLFVISACSSFKQAVDDRNYEATLKVQIEAEKKHNVFVSRDQSKEAYYVAQLIFALNKNGLHDHLNHLQESLLYEEDLSKALKWSEALAKYRFARDGNDRLEIMKDLIADSIAKGVFRETSSFLDCSKGRFILDFPDGERQIYISFHPSIEATELILHELRANEYSPASLNEAIKGFYDKVQILATSKKQKQIRGILYAWTNDSDGVRELQSCDMTIKKGP